MRTQKRNLVVVLALIVLVLPVVVACGGLKDTPPQSSAVDTIPESSLETLQETQREPCNPASSGLLAGVDPRGQTVIWWHPYSGTREADLQALINAFNIANACDITVIAENHGATLRDEMIAALTTGELPGLVVGDQNDQLLYTLSNGLADVSAYIDDEMWGLSREDRRDFVRAFLEGDDDPLFGFPLTRTVDVLFYNQTWLEELRFTDLPTDTETFKDMACAAVKVRDADGYVFNDVASTVASWTDALGGTILNNDRTGYSYNNKTVVDALTFLKELYDEGCADFSTEDSLSTEFAARRVLFAQGSSADIPVYRAAMDAAENAAESGDEWAVLAMPHGDAEPAPTIRGSDLMIPATNPETQLAAWIFLKWFAAPEQQAEWIHIDEEFPSRESVVALLDEDELMLQWDQAFALLSNGVPEPRLVSYPAVREAVTEAFDRIMQSDNIRGTLSRLNSEANDLQKKMLAEGIQSSGVGLCNPASSGLLAGIDPRGQMVTWWHSYDGALEADLQALIDAFNATNPCGITVVGQGQGDTLRDKMDAGITTGELPGLAVADQNDQAVYALTGALTDMNAYIADPDWGFTQEERADFFAPLLAQGIHPAFGGQRLGFPLTRSLEVLFYNQTWLETLRYSGPLTSTEGFETLTCAVGKARDAAETSVTGYVLRADATAMTAWAAAFGGVSPAGGAVLNAGGDEYAYNTPPVVEAMTYLKVLYDEGCITSTITGTPSAHFAARRAPFILGSSADIPLYQQAMEVAENEDVWGVTTLPYSGTVPAPIVYGNDFIIPTTNPETQLAAWIFLKWFTAPEQQTRWIRTSGEFPTRASVAAQVEGEQFSSQWLQAQWLQALALLPYGVYEPQLISYPSVDDALASAFDRIMQGIRVQLALDRLTREANTLQKSMME
ncbi:MAG: extracellular solute-binding protein [Anaerolineae bacterium]|nr:extracellular solute-binding protein [Anaerolineae bacterium]